MQMLLLGAKIAKWKRLKSVMKGEKDSSSILIQHFQNKKKRNRKSVLHTSINGSVIRMFPNAEMTSKIWCVFFMIYKKNYYMRLLQSCRKENKEQGGPKRMIFSLHVKKSWKTPEKIARNYDWIRKQSIIIVDFGLHLFLNFACNVRISNSNASFPIN